MFRFLISFVFLLMIVSSAIAQDSRLTNNKPNGNWWMGSSEPQKYSLVIGILNGILVVEDYKAKINNWSDLQRNAVKDYDEARFRFTKMPGVPVRDIVEKMNVFYQDPQNLSIPLASCYSYLCLEYYFGEMEGWDPVKQIEQMRKDFSS